jgi:zinc D-Ala-D-Ala carboxypeptidase
MSITTALWPWDKFPKREMQCKCGCGAALVDPTFMNRLMQLRRSFGRPMIVSSGYRCPTHNAKVSSTGSNGPHTTGHAVDIAVRGVEALHLIPLAMTFGFTGIGVKQKGGERFMHFDDLPNIPSIQPRPHIWSY